jgi:hypothetical protein
MDAEVITASISECTLRYLQVHATCEVRQKGGVHVHRSVGPAANKGVRHDTHVSDLERSEETRQGRQGVRETRAAETFTVTISSHKIRFTKERSRDSV